MAETKEKKQKKKMRFWPFMKRVAGRTFVGVELAVTIGAGMALAAILTGAVNGRK